MKESRDYFARLAEENKVGFLKVAEIGVRENPEKLRGYEENQDYFLDQYRIIGFKPREKTELYRKYRIEFPISETKTEALQWLNKLIEDMGKDDISAHVLVPPETQKVPAQKYPLEAKKRLIEKYYKKDKNRINRDIEELEWY